MGKHVRVNGQKLPVNLNDVVFLDRLVRANGVLRASIAAADVEFPGDDPQAQYKRVEACVNATCRFFDEAFGDGTAQKIFNRTNEAGVYLKAIQDFSHGLSKIDKAFCKRIKYGGTLKFDTALGLQKGSEK